MTCKPCAEQRQRVRDAWVSGRIAEAVKEAAKGAAMMAKGKPDGK